MEASVARVAALPIEAIGPIPDVIERARAGDREAFAELYDHHVDSVYRYLLYRVREPSDAEDLTSEVFTRAFANIHRYRWQGKSFLAWLYTIARNRCLSVLRARREHPVEEIDLRGPGVERDVQQRLDLRELLGDIAELPHEQRTALVLAELGDLSQVQIAEALSCETKRVKSLAHEAR